MTNILGSEHIFHVFRVHPQDDGSVKRQFIGRFMEHDGEFHILEDHDGVLAGIPEGPITGDRTPSSNTCGAPPTSTSSPPTTSRTAAG
jgi:hypothetical protein